MKGILGRKIGMTQVFTTDGVLIPVTVVEATENVVLQKKTVATDGYDAVKVGFEDKREKLANKAEKGIANKANTAPKRFIKEFRYDEMMSYEVGDKITVDSFVAGEVVDVTGTSKVKVIKVLLRDMDNTLVLKDMVQELIELLVQWDQLLQTESLRVKNYQDKWDM